MATPPTEDLEAFLCRQDAGDLVAVLLELAKDHEAVQARLARMQLADRPDKLAAGFKKTLSGWRRSTKFYGYREAGEFGRQLDGWLDQVARELLPKDPPAALALFEAFIAKSPAMEVFRISGALSLLSESLRDPDVKVRASLRYSPNPNPVQRQDFVRAYLDADRPADAMAWLQDAWGHLEDSRQDLLADALERLGRFEESSPIRQRMFERTLSDFYFQRWLEHLPEAARPEAVAHARQLALRHDDLTAAATLLLQLGDAAAAEDRLLAEPGRIDGNDYGRLVPLAKVFRADECPRGEAVVYRALLKGILDRAFARAHVHAARYWTRLGEIAGSDVSLLPLPSHEDFEAEIRARHGRKSAFWAYVNGTRRDRHDDEDDLTP